MTKGQRFRSNFYPVFKDARAVFDERVWASVTGPVAQLGERLVCIQEVQSPRAERRVGAMREHRDRLESTSPRGETDHWIWARSSAGRAPGLHPGGRRFDPGRVHQRLLGHIEGL